MADEDESSIEAAIQEMLANEDKSARSAADKVRRKPRIEAVRDDGAMVDPLDAEGPAEAEPEGSAEIETLRAERDDMRDRFMRALADAENARKRSDRDRKEAENYGGSKLSRDMLPVHDALRRAVDLLTDEQRKQNAALVEGVELTLRELVNVFAKHGIRTISPQPGDKFDANTHEAMFEASVPGTRKGEIIQVMANGFMLHDRLLRAAQVGVSSTPSS